MSGRLGCVEAMGALGVGAVPVRVGAEPLR